MKQAMEQSDVIKNPKHYERYAIEPVSLSSCLIIFLLQTQMK